LVVSESKYQPLHACIVTCVLPH